MYTVPYLIKKNPKVLIIGMGGGNDVFAAQLMGATDITGCEINAIITELIKERYSEFVGNIYHKENTRVYTAEGRSFIRRSEETYDLIQMTSVDTWAGLSSGAYVLSENYLYTVDAFKDYFSHLNKDGMLCIIRLFFSPPREVLRLVSTASQALKQNGVDDPSSHIAVVSVVGGGLAAVMVKKSPFTQQELDTLVYDRYYDPAARVIFAGGINLGKLNPGFTDEELSQLHVQAHPFFTLLNYFSQGIEDTFFETYHFDVTPITDNSPFFFEFYKWKNFLRDFKGVGLGGWGGDTVRPIALLILGGTTLQASVLSLLFILGPLVVFKKYNVTISGKFPFIAYFCCLGLAYMLLEIVCMQICVLFLGHPIYSISVVLSSFLIFSGLGSLAAGWIRWDLKKTVVVSIGIIVLYGLGLVLGLQKIMDLFLGYPLVVRAGIVWVVLFPVAFCMGMPFPTGLKTASMVRPELVPWAIGTNGCASVTASILTIILAMGMGFSAVMVTGLLIYIVALLCFLSVKIPIHS
jgi:spermidine synthase